MTVNDLATSHSICAETVPSKSLRPFLMPKYVSREITRHGKTIYYYRKDGRRYRIHAEPGSDDFYNEVREIREGRGSHARAAHNSHTGWVYFALSGSRVKIGYSKNPRARAAALKIGSARHLRIFYVTPGTMALERELHRQFAEDRVNGEWFLYSKPIQDWIRADEARRIRERGV